MYVRNQRVKPLKRYTGSNLVDMGRGAVHARLRWATPWLCEVSGLGGYEEGLRRTRGDAAGARLGAGPADRDTLNVGSAPAPPGGAAAQAAARQVRHTLMGPGVAEPP